MLFDWSLKLGEVEGRLKNLNKNVTWAVTQKLITKPTSKYKFTKWSCETIYKLYYK